MEAVCVGKAGHGEEGAGYGTTNTTPTTHPEPKRTSEPTDASLERHVFVPSLQLGTHSLHGEGRGVKAGGTLGLWIGRSGQVWLPYPSIQISCYFGEYRNQATQCQPGTQSHPGTHLTQVHISLGPTTS